MWVLILFALAAPLIVRVFTWLGLHPAFYFAHFAVICVLAVVLILTSSDKTMLRWLVGLGAFPGSVVMSAIWNEAMRVFDRPQNISAASPNDDFLCVGRAGQYRC